ncbi:MAG: hypothetical protein QXK97_00060 [Acidilobaceae archaeon]
MERIRAAREGWLQSFVEKLDLDSQVYTFWIALLALREAGSVRLLDEFIERELELARRHLDSEEDRDVLRIAESLGLRVKPAELRVAVSRRERGELLYKVFGYAIPLRDFLRVSSKSRAGELRLVNNPVRDGVVYLDGETLRLLVSEAFRARLAEKLREIEAPESPAFRELAEKLREIEALALSGLDELSLPQCIRELATKASKESLSDLEAHTIVSFLKASGAPRDAVAVMLKKLGLADERVAETIARALEEIEAPGPLRCEELRKRGVCDCDRDLTLEYRERRSRGSGRAREPEHRASS